jgi:hypothetical protein
MPASQEEIKPKKACAGLKNVISRGWKDIFVFSRKRDMGFRTIQIPDVSYGAG